PARPTRGSVERPPGSPGPLARDHPDGAVGVGSVDQRDQEPRYAQATGRGEHLQDAGRKAPALLLQPRILHGPGALKERQAGPSLKNRTCAAARTEPARAKARKWRTSSQSIEIGDASTRAIEPGRRRRLRPAPDRGCATSAGNERAAGRAKDLADVEALGGLEPEG